MKNLALLMLLACTGIAAAQESKAVYDEALAKSLGADERGMKQYVMVILKTGSYNPKDPTEKNALFQGHMDNINRLAKERKLAVAGPFGKNALNYRGIFIMNCETVGEAVELTMTDPAIKAKLFEAEYLPWYGSAALIETLKIHDRIEKPAKK